MHDQNWKDELEPGPVLTHEYVVEQYEYEPQTVLDEENELNEVLIFGGAVREQLEIMHLVIDVQEDGAGDSESLTKTGILSATDGSCK